MPTPSPGRHAARLRAARAARRRGSRCWTSATRPHARGGARDRARRPGGLREPRRHARASPGRPTASRSWRTAAGQDLALRRASGERTAVPFKAAVEQRVTDARALPARAWTPTRCARASCAGRSRVSDGKRLVFSGRRPSVRDGPAAGTPRRLTSGTDLEYAPAFSPDGSRDRLRDLERHRGRTRLGAHAAAARRSRSRQGPAQYANPSFSPDGKPARVPEGQRRAPSAASDPGDELWHEIHWVGACPAAEPLRDRRSEPRAEPPHGAADLLRRRAADLLHRRRGRQAGRSPEDARSARCGSTAPTPRAPALAPRPRRPAVSPDARYVAFNELHNAYVTAMPDLTRRRWR